jgi:dihydroxyacetone kinase-like predicted kinase
VIPDVTVGYDDGPGEPRYEVMFLLGDADEAAVTGLRRVWAELGESIAVVGGDDEWSCHIHTDDIDAAVAAGAAAGRLSRVQVTDLVEQVHQRQAHEIGDHHGVRRVSTGVVAVAVGAGLGRLLRSVGAQEIVAGGQTSNPSTGELLAAVQRISADGVVVLPNNGNVIAVAQQLDGLTDRSVRVVPTHSVVEALAALVVYDEDVSLDANVVAMAEAAARVHAGDVTRAVRAASAACGPVAAGDWLALAGGDIAAIGASQADAAIALVDHLVAEDSELVTVLVGEDASSRDTDRVRDHLRREHPHVEVEIHEGDQPLYPYLIGVE